MQFSKIIERRNTNSLKWDHCEEYFGRDDILPLWVADSDWSTAPAVIREIEKTLKKGIMGYTRPSEELDQVIVDWVKKEYSWKIKPEWIVYTNGIVPSISTAVRTFVKPGQKVILQPPVYYPFFSSVENNGAQILNNELVNNNGRYIMDLEKLKKDLSDGNRYKTKMIILCSPHNPGGRVWEKEELYSLGKLCLEKDILIISDDIHADLIYGDRKHIPIASLSRDFAHNSITMFSPGKTLNIAGLQVSALIIPNTKLRKEFTISKGHTLTQGNILGLAAMKAAYSECDEWISKQLDYLEQNLEFTLNYFNEKTPTIKPVKPDGTYLLWLDCRDMELNQKELMNLMVNKARVGLNDGTWFGPGGKGFLRLNFACPKKTLEEGLKRIENAVT